MQLLPYYVFNMTQLFVGNSWGCDDTTCCVGCGEIQEEFYACADISIRAADFPPTTPEVTTTLSPPSPGRVCLAKGQWKRVAGMDDWCRTTCVAGNVCPESHCECTGSDPDVDDNVSAGTGRSCVAAGPWRGSSAMDAWCAVNCPAGLCPYNTCTCS